MPKSTRNPTCIYYAVFPSPWGLMGVAATPLGLCRVLPQIVREADFRDYLQDAYRVTPAKKPGALKEIKKQFDLYFSGKLRRFSCPLDMIQGTPFQKKVWRKLTAIPFGATRSYQWLAKAVGAPAACRAVGNANGDNPLPIVVPCHRVVRKNGEMGGYSGGLRVKRFLLDLEKSHGAV